MRRLLICLALVTGCRSFEVRAFDIALSPGEPRLMAAATDSDELSPWAAAALIAAAVGFGVLYYNYGSS